MLNINKQTKITSEFPQTGYALLNNYAHFKSKKYKR